MASTAPGMSGVNPGIPADGLQSGGYVTRTPGAHGSGDRRTVSLDLSDQGAAAVSRWHRVNEEIIQAALTALPQRDRAALRDAAPALRDLTFSIDAQADLAARWLGGRGYLPVGRLGGRVGLAI